MLKFTPLRSNGQVIMTLNEMFHILIGRYNNSTMIKRESTRQSPVRDI